MASLTHHVFFAVPLLCLLACSVPGETEIARGNVLASRQQYEQAIEAYRAATQVAPKRARPQELLGHVLFDLKKNAEARAAYEAALKAEPQGALEAQIGLSRLDAEEGKLDEAIARLGKILEKQPDNVYARLSRANVALRRGAEPDVAMAIEDTARAMQVDSKNPSVLYHRGCAFIAAKNPNEAAKAFDLLIQKHPTSPLGPYGHARLASTRSDKASILTHLKTARERATVAGQGWKPGEVVGDPAFQFLREDKEFLTTIGATQS